MHFLTIFYFTGHPESDDLFGDHSLPSSSLPNPFWRDPSLYTDKVFHYLREPHPFPFPGRGVRGWSALALSFRLTVIEFS